MAKKLVLEFDEELDYSVIGISSPLRDYKLVFNLNRVLQNQFRRISAFENGQQNLNYSMYFSEDELNQYFFYLISNHSNGNYIFPEYKLTDFLLFIDGEIQEKYMKDLIRKIRSLSNVQIASQIDTNKIKNYYSSIFELEKHIQFLKIPC